MTDQPDPIAAALEASRRHRVEAVTEAKRAVDEHPETDVRGEPPKPDDDGAETPNA